MEIALIISLIALAVALPGCIADSLTVIAKIQAQFKKMKHGGLARPRNLFKKGEGVGPDLLKKSKKRHLNGITNQASKALRKSKKESGNWSGLFISQEECDETRGILILKKIYDNACGFFELDSLRMLMPTLLKKCL